FQVGGVGPMFGQFGHFFKYAKDKCEHPYPRERYQKEAQRILGVLEKRLTDRPFLVGDEYSIADMATVPWVNCLDSGYGAREVLELDKFERVMNWCERVMKRPLTLRGSQV